MGKPRKGSASAGSSKGPSSSRGPASVGMRKSNRGKSPSSSAAHHVQAANKGSAQNILEIEDNLDIPDEVGVKSSVGYFACKGASSASTSSLMELGLTLGEGTQVSDVLERLPVRHCNEIEALRVKLAAEFPRWRLLLREGFSLLLYGFGSKRRILEECASTHLKDGGLLVVNGFLPTASAKSIVSSCALALLRSDAPQGKSGSTAAQLEAMRLLPSDPALYVVLHNIDGPALRDPESQDLLSQLAQCPAIRLAASIDHVDAPLLWDKQTAARFNWTWKEAATYGPYVAEAAHVPPLLLGRKNERTAKGAAVVLGSLTHKAREVFRQLADNQDAGEGSKEQGIPFPQWFKICRERFLVTSELLLRTHLTEFKDHELVRTRRGADGTDLYYIPLDKATLERVLEEMNMEA